MGRTMRLIGALGAVAVVAVGVAACGGSAIPSGAVVAVGQTQITKASFDHWMKIVAASSGGAVQGETAPKPVVPDPPTYSACIAHLRSTLPSPKKGQPKQTNAQLKSQCEQEYKTYKQQALGFLISASWVVGEAKERGISVTNKAVEKEFIKLKKAQFKTEAEFKKLLASTDQTTSDLLLNLKLHQLSRKIEEQVSKKAKKTVSKAQAQKYYDEHKSSYGQPERRNLRIILTKTETQANSAKGEVASGKSFASVAKSVSIDPVSKANGGVLNEVRPGQEEKALDTAIFAAKTGVLSGPVKTPFGYYVFEVTKVLPGSEQAFSKVESAIKAQLAQQSRQEAITKFVTAYRKKWTARTECRSGYVIQDCKAYKEPKTTTSATSTTSSAASKTKGR